jgi:hypothetical protein
MQKSDDDFPEMAPSRADVAAETSRARARLITAANGKTLWDVVDGYTLDALIELRMALDSPNPKIRFHAARDIAAVWTRMPPRPDAGLVQPNETDEQRGQRLRTLFRHAPPVLRKALLEWKQEEDKVAQA